MLKKQHTGHLGINLCLRRARELIFGLGCQPTLETTSTSVIPVELWNNTEERGNRHIKTYRTIDKIRNGHFYH